MRTALAIAGSDPTGGAGMQLDLQVFRVYGLHGAGVPTALTVQDSERVHQSLPVFPSIVLDQLRTLLRDITPASVKIGMLATDDVLRNVAIGLAELPDEVPVVIDPVLVASSGATLLERRAWPGLLELAARAACFTPNISEAEMLTGEDAGSRRGAESAARALLDSTGAGAVLLKGGHRPGSADDLLAIAGHPPELHWFEGERIEGDPVHGTGCALSSALAAELARGVTLLDAVNGARSFVRAAIEGAQSVGRGARFLDLGRAAS